MVILASLETDSMVRMRVIVCLYFGFEGFDQLIVNYRVDENVSIIDAKQKVRLVVLGESNHIVNVTT